MLFNPALFWTPWWVESNWKMLSVLLWVHNDHHTATFLLMTWMRECREHLSDLQMTQNWVEKLIPGKPRTKFSLDRLEQWAENNIMKFNRDTCKVLHLGEGEPNAQLQNGGYLAQLLYKWEGSWNWSRSKAECELIVWCGCKKGKCNFRMHQQKSSLQISWSNSSPLFSHWLGVI